MRRGFNDGQQFALQRAMMPLGTLAQPLNDVVRCIFDGECHGHSSKLAPFWRQIQGFLNPGRYTFLRRDGLFQNIQRLHHLGLGRDQ